MTLGVVSCRNVFFAWLAMFFIAFGASCTPIPEYNATINNSGDTQVNETIVDEVGNSALVSRQYKKTLKMSKESAVIVWGIIDGNRVVRGSGTYFKHKGYHIVMTAYHVYDNPRIEGAMVQSQDSEIVAGTIIYSNRDRDICVLLVPKMRTVKAASLRPIRPAQASEGLEVLYTGFPGSHQHREPLTLQGTLAGVDDGTGYIIIQSYAWMGSSGSGIFDLNGRYVGVLVALDVERGLWGRPELQENIVYVSPIWGVNVEEIESLLKDK